MPALLGVAIAAGTWFVLRGESGASIPSAMPVERASSAVIEDPVLAQPELEIACPTIEPQSAGASETLAPAVVADERKTVTARPPRPSSLEGRIVDARTQQGLPGIEVTFRRLGQTDARPRVTDNEGRFSASPWSSDLMHLELEDLITGKSLGFRSVMPADLDPIWPNGLVVPVDVGPTLIVRLIDAPEKALGWRFGLKRVNARVRRKDDVIWRKAQLWGHAGLWMARYRKLDPEIDPKERLALCVTDVNEDWEGETEVEGAFGVHTAEIRVSAVAKLTGRVVDEDGAPVRATVTVLRRGERRAAPAISTKQDGTWLLKGVAPGPTRIIACSEGRAPSILEHDVARGENPFVEIVLPRVRDAGQVTGALIGPIGGPPPMGMLVLDSIEPRRPVRIVEWANLGDAEGSRSHFAFSHVPEGRYVLEFHPADGRTYEPRSLEVAPPAVVSFETSETEVAAQFRGFELRLRDAVSGAELSSNGVRVRRNVKGVWLNVFKTPDYFARRHGKVDASPTSLVVSKRGYRPAWVPLPTPAPSAPVESGLVVLQVDLEPGFGAAIVVLDGESVWNAPFRSSRFEAARGLAGARILSGGRVIGTTDELGLALCRDHRPIESIEVEREGWVAADHADTLSQPVPDDDGHGLVYMVRSD